MVLQREVVRFRILLEAEPTKFADRLAMKERRVKVRGDS